MIEITMCLTKENLHLLYYIYTWLSQNFLIFIGFVLTLYSIHRNTKNANKSTKDSRIKDQIVAILELERLTLIYCALYEDFLEKNPECNIHFCMGKDRDACDEKIKHIIENTYKKELHNNLIQLRYKIEEKCEEIILIHTKFFSKSSKILSDYISKIQELMMVVRAGKNHYNTEEGYNVGYKEYSDSMSRYKDLLLKEVLSNN